MRNSLPLLFLLLATAGTGPATESDWSTLAERWRNGSDKHRARLLETATDAVGNRGREGALAGLALVEALVPSDEHSDLDRAKEILDSLRRWVHEDQHRRLKVYRHFLTWHAAVADRGTAERALDRFLDEGNGEFDVDAAYFLGLILREQGDDQEAARCFRFALTRLRSLEEGYYTGLITRRRLDGLLPREPEAPPTAEELFRRAEEKRRSGKWLAARKRYRQVIELEPEPSLALRSRVWRSVCTAEGDDLRQGIEELLAFLVENPEGPWWGLAHLELGKLHLFRRLDLSSAHDHFLAVLQPSSRDWGQSGVRPADPGARIDPRPDASWEPVLADAFEHYGICALHLERWETAVAAFEAEIRRRPTRQFRAVRIPSPMRDLLRLARERRSPVVMARAATREDPATATALHLASCWSECGNHAAAKRMLGAILADEPEICRPGRYQRQIARHELADVERRLGDDDRALDLWTGLLEDAPDSPLAGHVLVQLAALHFARGRDEEALPLLREAVAEHRSSPVHDLALYNLAWSHYFDDELDQAESLFRRLIRLHPRSRYAELAERTAIPWLEKEPENPTESEPGAPE